MLLKEKAQGHSGSDWTVKEDALIIACWNEDVSDTVAEGIFKVNGFTRSSVSIGSRRRRKMFKNGQAVVTNAKELGALSGSSEADTKVALEWANEAVDAALNPPKSAE